ncbi:SCN2A [Symbiodinium microadriaticum]|nr:SCN2A [Symbiodinium microadriaticum]CAE7863376.1 SCN2A [Symbiodinium sp. KB8]
MSWLVKNHYLANATAVIVLFDAYLACVDIDYRALDQETPALVVRLSDVCLLMYTLELCLFLAVHGICIIVKLWRDVFFMIDVGVLLCGYVELVLSVTGMGEFFGRIGMLRLLRVARVLRLTRLLRKSTSLKELRRLLTMMATCMKALGWSFLICFAVMTFWAMLLVEIVHPIVKESGADYFGDCTQCLRATSSVMEANLLLFKTVIAGDSWGQIAVPVIEDHPETAIIFVGSQLTLVFGVLNLIVAVVVDTFAEARQSDLVNLAEELEQDMAADQRSLQKIFNRIDADGSGEVTLAELVEGAQRDPEFRSRLQVMDIDEVDLQQLFEMIDIEGQGQVNVMEFVTPLSRWVRDSKTAPRFVKYNMMRLMRRHEEFVGSVDARFELLAVHLDEMNSVLHYLSGTSCSFASSECSTEQADLEVGHQDSLCSRVSTGAPGATLSKQMQRLSLKHKTMETATTTELEWVEDEMAEEQVEQPPLSKKAHLPSLLKEQHWIERETLQTQEKALASAFRNAVEVLKQSVLEATDRAVQSSLSTVDSAMKDSVKRHRASPKPDLSVAA